MAAMTGITVSTKRSIDMNGNEFECPYCGNDCKNDREYACAEYSSDPDGLVAAMEENNPNLRNPLQSTQSSPIDVTL